MLTLGLTLEAGATGTVKVIKMSTKLLTGPRQRAQRPDRAQEPGPIGLPTVVLSIPIEHGDIAKIGRGQSPRMK